MPSLFDKYRFTVNDGATDTPLTPIISGLKRRWESEGDGRFYRQKLATPLLFRGADFVFFKDIRDAGTCVALTLTIEELCAGVWADWFVGKVLVFEGDYNYSRCEVTFEVVPADAFECFNQSLDKKLNWLDYGAAIDLTLIIGSIETLECFTTTNPPTNDNSVLWFYKGCWGSGFVTDSDPDGSLAWRPIVHQQHFDTGDSTSSITTKWARETITQGAMPVGDGWVNIGGSVWVRPIVYGVVTDVITVDGASEERDWTAPMLNPKFLTNSRVLKTALPLILTEMDCDILEIQSDLLSINPPNDHPANDAYDFAAANLDNVVYFQKSDVVTGNASDDATRLEMSLRDFLESLSNSLQAFYTITGSGASKVLRIEHWTWFNTQPGIDLTTLDGGKYIVGLEQFKTTEQVPAWEQFSYQESFREPFLFQRIDYPKECATQPGIDRALNLMCADVGGLSENTEAGLEGFVFVCTHNNFGFPLLNTLGAEANGAMAWYNILPALWSDGRARLDATATVAGYAVTSLRKRRQQARITANLCCDGFEPSELITTQLGEGEIKEAEQDTMLGTLSLTLMHE